MTAPEGVPPTPLRGDGDRLLARATDCPLARATDCPLARATDCPLARAADRPLARAADRPLADDADRSHTATTARSRATDAGLTRREVVIAGGGLALAAAVGLGPEHGRLTPAIERYLARFQGGHVPPSAGGTVIYRTFHSRVLGRAVDYGVALPRGVGAGTPLPVCFCLPGRGGGPDSVLGSGLSMADFLGEVVDGSGRPFALASVAGGQSYWHRRTSGEDRMAMLVEEFIPLCKRRYRLGGSRARRAAMGWSMGGYGVLLAAETYPDLFSAVVATAPAVWPTYQDMMNGPGDAFDSAADFAAHDVIGHADRLAGTPLLVECGTVDPFYPFVRQLCQRLPSGDHHRFSFGSHANAYWRSLEPAALRFVAWHLGSDSGRRSA